MKKALVAILAVIGGLSILAVLAVGLLIVVGASETPTVASRTILEIDFERGLVEALPDDPFAEFLGDPTLAVRDVVDALDRAAEDRRVKALVARVGAAPMGLAHIQEVRDAVARFRRSGKPAVVFAETFGEFGPGNGAYYLATAFEEIYLQPSGDVGLNGLMYSTMFVRGLLDKIGVEPRMDQRHEYKNAMNTYTERGYTVPHRESMQALVDSQFGQLVRGIAASRNLSEDDVRALVDRGPFLAPEALEAGLVDGLMYRDEVYAKLRERVGERAELLFPVPYLERAKRPNRRGTTVALVHGYGAVTRGSSHHSSFDETPTMGSDTVAGALRAAVEDPGVEAILLRVDSPGGSYVASDTIWRETIRAREAGKPLIVSMGNVAGSGGYFVAMHADKVVAQPGTITASIGVLGGKLLTAGMWEKLGIGWDDVQAGRNSGMYDSGEDYSAAGYERFQAGLDRVYEDFTTKVADGRGLPIERVLEIAKGRIWTGEQALDLGLVDALGGYETALGLVREALGLDPDAPLRIEEFPERLSAWDALFGEEPESSEASALRALGGLARDLRPFVRAWREATAEPATRVLAIPDPGPVR